MDTQTVAAVVASTTAGFALKYSSISWSSFSFTGSGPLPAWNQSIFHDSTSKFKASSECKVFMKHKKQ